MFIGEYTLAELDKTLDHAPINVFTKQGTLRYEIRKEHSITTEGRHYSTYQVSHIDHGEWKSTHGGFRSLDELVLNLAFPYGSLESPTVESGGVLSLPEGERGELRE